MIGDLCGEAIPNPVTSSSNVLYMHFHSDDYDPNNMGFKVRADRGKPFGIPFEYIPFFLVNF